MGKALVTSWSFVWWHDIERHTIYEHDKSNFSRYHNELYGIAYKNIHIYNVTIVNRQCNACTNVLSVLFYLSIVNDQVLISKQLSY